MRPRIAAIVTCLSLQCLVASGVCAAPLDRLAWLAGSWKREARGRTTLESWTRVGERVLEGRGSMVSGEDKTPVPTEDMLIVEMAGEVFFIAKVAENKYPVAFRLTASDDHSATFENPEHDFPQKVSYQLKEDGTLLAAIEGPGGPGGAARRIEYPFNRETK